MRNNYKFNSGEYHENEYRVDNPQGMANHRESDRHGVPFADLVSLELPPPKTSTGLRTPEVASHFLTEGRLKWP